MINPEFWRSGVRMLTCSRPQGPSSDVMARMTGLRKVRNVLGQMDPKSKQEPKEEEYVFDAANILQDYYIIKDTF
jgi:hypothetical protein